MKVREILKYQPLELRTLGDIVKIEYENGEVIEHLIDEVIINRYMFQMFINVIDLPIISTYSITKYFKNGMFTNNTINKVFSKMRYDIIEDLTKIHLDINNILELFDKSIFEIVTKLYSEYTYSILDYSIGLNILDLLELQLDPDMVKAMDTVYQEGSVKAINDAYDVLDDNIMLKDYKYTNPAARSYIANTIKTKQFRQTIGPRGFANEIDSSIYDFPVHNSYTQGLNDLYTFGIESRSAANALFHSTTSIRDSEWFARELQLATMVVRKLIYTDCGNRDYINWVVSPPGVTIHNDVYVGDLKHLSGKQYKLEENAEWMILKGDEDHLIGKTVLLRSVFGCKLKNSQHVCSECFGRLAYSIPSKSNLGTVCGVTASSQISQGMLSTKHHITSAGEMVIVLNNDEKRYFDTKKNGFILKKEFKKKDEKNYIIVSQEAFYGLKDLKDLSVLNTIDPKRVSRIEGITIETVKSSGEVINIPITIQSGNSRGVFTGKFLEYVLRGNFTIDTRGNYIINIDKWNLRHPIITLPNTSFDFKAFGKEITKLIKTRPVNKTTQHSHDTMESLLSKLFTLTNSKLNINIALLEVIVYAFSFYDVDNNDYSLARMSSNPQLGGLDKVIAERSLSALLGHGAIVASLLDVSSMRKDKVSHPLDLLFDSLEASLDYDLNYA